MHHDRLSYQRIKSRIKDADTLRNLDDYQKTVILKDEQLGKNLKDYQDILGNKPTDQPAEDYKNVIETRPTRERKRVRIKNQPVRENVEDL